MLLEANCKDKFGEDIKAFEYITVFDKTPTQFLNKLQSGFITQNLGRNQEKSKLYFSVGVSKCKLF